MKKKLISVVLLAVMCLSLAPMSAWAEDAPSCICQTPCTEDAFNPDCPICGADGAVLADCAQFTAPAEDIPAATSLALSTM